MYATTIDPRLPGASVSGVDDWKNRMSPGEAAVDEADVGLRRRARLLHGCVAGGGLEVAGQVAIQLLMSRGSFNRAGEGAGR